MSTCPECRRDLPDDFVCCPYDGTSLGSGEPRPSRAPESLPPADRVMLAGLHERFDVKKKLGQGAMGTVYHAVERSAGMDVAIKVMTTAAARSGPERARFLREAEMMLPLQHPNVMHVFAAGQLLDGSPYIVMQYVEGEPLGALFRRGEAVSQESALRIASDAAAGLAAAHAEGIIHRDVKPDNIFILGAPARVVGVKVFDFGLARLSGASGLTAKGMIVGTPEYMAPEQTVNEPTDGRTDVYALGVVLYRLLTGALPFAFPSDIELLAAHLVLAPPPIAAVLRVHEATERVVFGALRKAPSNRYPSMSDFREDVERLRAGRYAEVLGPPALREDVYEPKAPFSQNVASILRRKAAALVKGTR